MFGSRARFSLSQEPYHQQFCTTEKSTVVGHRKGLRKGILSECMRVGVLGGGVQG